MTLDLDALRGHTAGDWQRSDTTVYALMHDGWRRGEETFRNRVWLNVSFDREVPQEEREATVAAIQHAPQLLSELLAYRARDAAVAELVAALDVLANIPIEDFSLEKKPATPLMSWNDHQLRVEHVLAARAALAAFRQGAARED